MTFALIMWYALGGADHLMVIGHYRDQQACLEMGYRIQKTIPGFIHGNGNFYCVEDTSPQSK